MSLWKRNMKDKLLNIMVNAPFFWSLKAEENSARRTAVACFYKEKQMTFVAELLFKMVCGVPRSKRLCWFVFFM